MLNPYNGAAPDVYITQVFRREEQTIGAVGFMKPLLMVLPKTGTRTGATPVLSGNEE